MCKKTFGSPSKNSNRREKEKKKKTRRKTFPKLFEYANAIMGAQQSNLCTTSINNLLYVYYAKECERAIISTND